MTRRTVKIFYPAGFISIIFLPIFCIWNLYINGHFEKIGAIDVSYFYHSEEKAYSSNRFVEKIKLARNYSKIEFTGNEALDRAILKYAKVKVAEIVNSKDTINGLLFELNKNAKYKDFVSAVDISNYKEARSVIDGDNLWIFYLKPIRLKKEESYFICGTNEYSRKAEMKAEKKDAFHQYLREKINSFLLLSILFLLMCFFAFKK